MVRSQICTLSSKTLERFRAWRGVSSESNTTVSTVGSFDASSSRRITRALFDSDSSSQRSPHESSSGSSTVAASSSAASVRGASSSSNHSSSSSAARSAAASSSRVGSPHARRNSASFPLPMYVPGCGARRRWVRVPTTSRPAVSGQLSELLEGRLHAVLVRALVAALAADADEEDALLRGFPAPHVVADIGAHVLVHLALDEFLHEGCDALSEEADAASRRADRTRAPTPPRAETEARGARDARRDFGSADAAKETA